MEERNSVIYNMDLFQVVINGEKDEIQKYKLVSFEKYKDIVNEKEE